MSEFHYVRTLGPDGGVDAVDGPAIGMDLESILKDGLPPFKVAMEIAAALCEMLDIAEQDGETHGDIGPEYVFIDDTGAVSLEGFGADRESTRAPEGVPDGPVTDSYGLGYALVRLFGPIDLGALPDDLGPHDDAVIDVVVELPFGGVPDQYIGDLQWFMAKLLAADPDERPTPVEAWRTFIAFADESEGPLLENWILDAMEGGGERREAVKADSQAGPPPDEAAGDDDEDLGGPVVGSGPLSKGAISFKGGGGSSTAGATAFWSKEAMKAALDADEEEEPAFKPQAAAATSFWSKSDLQKMDEARPAAKRKTEKGERRSARVDKPTEPVTAAPSAPEPEAPQGVQAAPPPVAPPPVAPPPVITAAGGGGPTPPTGGDGGDDDDGGGGGGGGGMRMVIVGAVVVVLLLVCGGGLAAVGIGGAVVATSGSESADVEDDKKDEPKVEAKKDETKDSAEEEDDDSKRRRRRRRRRADDDEAKKPATSSKPKRRTNGVRFIYKGAGKALCGGNTKEGTGGATINHNFKTDGGTQCMVQLESGHICSKFISKPSTCSCKPDKGELICW